MEWHSVPPRERFDPTACQGHSNTPYRKKRAPREREHPASHQQTLSPPKSAYLRPPRPLTDGFLPHLVPQEFSHGLAQWLKDLGQ
eukprot:scaffold3575_cov107-Isochrysis_galbana.AAC.1